MKCVYCNKEFKPSKYQERQYRKGINVFCSKSCGTAFRYNKVNITPELISEIENMMNDTLMSYSEIQQKIGLNKIKFKKVLEQYNLQRSTERINEIKVTKAKQTMLEKYGVDNPMYKEEFRDKISKSHNARTLQQIQESTNKRKQSKLEKYGDETYHNIEQAKQTMLEKYGYTSGFQSKTSISNRKATSLERYGVDNPFKSQEIRDMGKEIIKEKYSVKESSLENPNIRAKASKTLKLKYGVDNIMKSSKYKKKMVGTMLERYNVVSGFLTENAINSHKCGTISKINRQFAEFIKPYVKTNITMEKSIVKYIYDLQINNILIDINPTVSHNVYISYPYRLGLEKENKVVPKDYHLQRTLNAKENGYKLISVFDWDDWNKIKYILQDKETLYARKLDIKEVDKDICDDFLNKYHIQNTCRGQDIRLGLFRDNELIQIMTFGKPRYNKNYKYELLRLCTKAKYQVVGGSEKLFKHFIDVYTPESIISYCDFGKFDGTVYDKLGFKQLSKISFNKHWVKGHEHITDNLLRQRGYDQLFKTNYGKGTSNEELMLKNGWLPIYDAGQLTFIWKS